MANPFIIKGRVPDELFCDRQSETDHIVRLIENNGDLLLTSKRRMGKTQLIRHCFGRENIKGNYYTFYTDIFPTTSLRELVLFISKEIYRALVPGGRKAVDMFLSFVKSLTPSLAYDPVTSMPKFSVNIGDIDSPELSLEEIFRFLEEADKPCVFAIDEFQQISKYPEKNVEALLRSFVQDTGNCRFIFAGSNRHILEEMFNDSSRPFFNSTTPVFLDAIDREVYLDFSALLFEKYGKKVGRAALEYAYDSFEGHTYYVHYLLHECYASADERIPVSVGDVAEALDGIIEMQSRNFADHLAQMSTTQKETLVAIAKEGKAAGVTSSHFVKKYSLASPSAVQNSVRALLDQNFLTYETDGKTKIYSVQDRFMNIWLKRAY